MPVALGDHVMTIKVKLNLRNVQIRDIQTDTLTMQVDGRLSEPKGAGYFEVPVEKTTKGICLLIPDKIKKYYPKFFGPATELIFRVLDDKSVIPIISDWIKPAEAASHQEYAVNCYFDKQGRADCPEVGYAPGYSSM